MSGFFRRLEAPGDPAMVIVGPHGQGAAAIGRPVAGEEPCPSLRHLSLSSARLASERGGARSSLASRNLFMQNR